MKAGLRLGTALAAAALFMSPLANGANRAGHAVMPARTIALVVQTRNGPRRFTVEVARTLAEQERGLMYRTNIAPDGGMLFDPYPPEGGAPRIASFWMKNTPSPLDIVFIRPDGTIANIAANAIPFSETALNSDVPVSAVLEILGGRAAELGISPGDRISWTLAPAATPR